VKKIALIAMVAGLGVVAWLGVHRILLASSHREAPITALDDKAGITESSFNPGRLSGESGKLIGISYNPGLMQNQIRTLDPASGITRLLNTFTFSSGGWYPGTFTLDPDSDRFYVQAGDGTLYTFDLKTGQILTTQMADTLMQTLAVKKLRTGEKSKRDGWRKPIAGEDRGLLIGISYNPGLMQNQIRTLDPASGITRLLNTFTFSSGGWYPGTFTLDPDSDRFYVQAGDGTLYTFDLRTGQILTTQMADTLMQTLAAHEVAF